MKLLKIDNHLGYFRDEDGSYREIDQITKESLLWILEKVLEGSGELEEYIEDSLKNQAHQVCYKSLYNNLKSLETRRQEFIDESERLFLEDYKRYAGELSPQTGAQDVESTTGSSQAVTE